MIIVVITMIVGFLVIHFLSIDSWIANVITQTSEVHKLQANALKNLARDRQTIYMYAISEAAGAQDENELKSALLQVHTDNFRVEDVDISNDNIMLKVKSLYKENLMSSGIDTCVTSTFYVDYPFRRLIEAADNVKAVSALPSYCASVRAKIEELEDGVQWYHDKWQEAKEPNCGWTSDGCSGKCSKVIDNTTFYYDPEQYKCSYSYHFTGDYISGTISEKYPHGVEKNFDDECIEKPCGCYG
jgi:hypothetical protein